MKRSRPRTLAAVALAVFLGAAHAQAQQTPAPATLASPEIGSVAPDFSIAGATRFGVLRDPVRLSDFRGKTVVLAFFYRARTKG